MADDIIGQKVKTIRDMTATEMDAEGWDHDNFGNPTVIVLENGVKLYPSRDSEGNGGGALFGSRPDGTQFGLA